MLGVGKGRLKRKLSVWSEAVTNGFQIKAGDKVTQGDTAGKGTRNKWTDLSSISKTFVEKGEI